MRGRKYKLLKGETIANPFLPSQELVIYRIKACRDIPKRGVRKGDIGGYVTDKMTLSHEGDCWIGGNAIVHGAAVTGNALVSGNAIVYAGTKTTSQTIHGYSPLIASQAREKHFSLARITIEDEAVIAEKARITAFDVPISYINPVKIRGNAYVGGTARLYSPALLEKNAAVYGESVIGIRTKIMDSAEIWGDAIIGQEVTIGGLTKVSGHASIRNNSMVFGNMNLSGNAKVAEYTRIDSGPSLYVTEDILIEPGSPIVDATVTTGNLEQDAINRMLEKMTKRLAWEKSGKSQGRHDAISAKSEAANSTKLRRYKELLQEILSSLKSYETDIVKIIKYPVMVDRTHEYTAAMLIARRAVSLIDPETEEAEFYEAVLEFDRAFHAAEANALKISNSLLKPEDQKKTRKAQDLFSIAIDSASTENEKEQAFKQGLKQLEGVILVPDQAVVALRAKAGLAELSV